MGNPNSSSEKAQKEIQRLLSEARTLVRQAEELAKENKLSFSFSIAYGMGGTFTGDPDEDWGGYDSSSNVGWHPSSHNC